MPHPIYTLRPSHSGIQYTFTTGKPIPCFRWEKVRRNARQTVTGIMGKYVARRYQGRSYFLQLDSSSPTFHIFYIIWSFPMLKLLLNFLMLTQSALFWGLNTQLIRFLIQLLKILHWKQGESSFFVFLFFFGWTNMHLLQPFAVSTLHTGWSPRKYPGKKKCNWMLDPNSTISQLTRAESLSNTLVTGFITSSFYPISR